MELVAIPVKACFIPFSNPLPAANSITRMKIPHKTPKAVSTVLNQLLLRASIISDQLSRLNNLLIAQGFNRFNIGGPIGREESCSRPGNDEDKYGCDGHRKIHGGITDEIGFYQRSCELNQNQTEQQTYKPRHCSNKNGFVQDHSDYGPGLGANGLANA